MNAVARPRGHVSVQLDLHLETFDGPLELLLLLIEQRRLPITQVSLAQVADQYLSHVRAQPALDPDLLPRSRSTGANLRRPKRAPCLRARSPSPESEKVPSN